MTGVQTCALPIWAFPFSSEVDDFLAAHDRIFVVEQNRDAQMRSLLMTEADVPGTKLIATLNYDGAPLTAEWAAAKAVAGKYRTAPEPSRIDEPDRPDSLSATPVPDRADHVFYDSIDGSVQVRSTGGTLVVVRGEKQLSPVLQRRRPGMVSPAVSPDGGVLIQAGDGHVKALRTADGSVLWDTPRNGGFAIAGPDWLAVQLGSAWDFYDPSDGRWLGYLDALGTFCTDRKGCSDGAGVPFRPEMGRAHPWKPYDGDRKSTRLNSSHSSVSRMPSSA